MRIEKHIECLKEVLDEIENALRDSAGLSSHQRRIAMMLSLGISEIVELYFHKLGVMKAGSRIKHEWFKKRDIRERLSMQITCPAENLKNLGLILDIAKDIEKARNDLAYGSPLEHDKLLSDEINKFLRMKKVVEKEVGDLIE